MSEHLLEQIVENTTGKQSFQIVVSDDTTRFTTKFKPSIELKKEKKYEMALVNLETYYSFPNITEKNNSFKYHNGVDWFEIRIPKGSYGIDDLNNYIQTRMKTDGQGSNKIRLTPNANTLQTILDLDDNFKVDFNFDESIGKMLGFDRKMYQGHSASENMVDILAINSILVNVNVIAGSYVNGSAQPTIYSFFPTVSPGYKIVERPRNLVYLPVILDTLYSIETRLTDQNDDLLDLRGERVTIRFHIREIKKKTMSRYLVRNVTISEGQKDKLRRALSSRNEAVRFKLSHEDLSGNDPIAWTKTQIRRMEKAQRNRKGLTLRLSPAQLRYNLRMKGGFLPVLMGLASKVLPILAKTVLPALGVGALSGLASSGVDKLIGSGLFLKRGGNTCRVEIDGKGLYLRPAKGRGLYLKRGNGLYLESGQKLGRGKVGRGLLFGPNSPFKNIPLLGMLL